MIEKDAERLSRFPVTKAYFFNSDDSPKTEGTLLKNPEYAQTLSAIAKQGAQAFYHGDIARDIIETVQNAPGNPGSNTRTRFSQTHRRIELTTGETAWVSAVLFRDNRMSKRGGRLV